MAKYFLILLLAATCQVYSTCELAIVSMFRNEAHYLKEWIEYHRLAGVGHFWLYNDQSTDNSLEVLAPYIEDGVVEVIDWRFPSPNWISRQVNAFVDGIKKGRDNGVKWVAMVDIDEFILPMKENTIPECLSNHFDHASAVFVNWRNFGTGGVYVSPDQPFLFQLTACSLKTHPDNSVGKSIVRPDTVDLDLVWYPHHFPLIPNENYCNGSGKFMPFRGIDLPTDGVHHDRYIRINHYVMRDEGYYQNVRLPKTSDKVLLEEHYHSFSLVRDYTLMGFIRVKHPDAYEKFWKKFSE